MALPRSLNPLLLLGAALTALGQRLIPTTNEDGELRLTRVLPVGGWALAEIARGPDGYVSLAVLDVLLFSCFQPRLHLPR